MPNTTLERTPGYRLQITFLDGVVTPWIDFTLEETVEVDEPTAASSLTPQRITDMLDASFELSFYNSADFNNANVQVNVGIAAMTILVPTDTNATMIDQAFFDLFPVPTWKIVKKSYKQDRKSGRITINATPGHLDLPVVP